MAVIENFLPPFKVGDNVLVSISFVDRGRGDAANLFAVIIEEKDEKESLKKGF
jgi:hypothetical protein